MIYSNVQRCKKLMVKKYKIKSVWNSICRRKRKIIVCMVSRMGDMYVSNALGKEFVNTNDVRANVTYVVKTPTAIMAFQRYNAGNVVA